MESTTALALPPAADLAPTAMPADQHPARIYLAGLAPGSRRTLSDALNTIAAMLTGGRCDADRLPWHELRFQHTQAVRAQLAARYAPATANKHLVALRGVLKNAWRLGLMDAESYHRAADLQAVKGSTLLAGRLVPEAELRALFANCASDTTAAGRKDAALLAVLYGAGLRRAEVVALDLADYDRGTGALTVRSGKGHKARTTYATNGSRRALEAWIDTRGTEPGPLFMPVLKGGRIARRRLTADAIWHTLEKRWQSAGVPKLSPHDFRRTFITNLIKAGADLVSVQHLAGHASLTTTGRYDRSGEEAKLHAAELLHIPYTESGA